MSYMIIKNIQIKNNKVYLTTAESNVYPRTFETYENEVLTNLLASKGEEDVYKHLGRIIWEGTGQLRKGTKICNLFIKAQEMLPSNLNWLNFDSKAAGEFLGAAVMKLKSNPDYNLSKEIKELLSLRNNKRYILDVAKRTSQNLLNYADAELQKDREFAFEVLRAAKGGLLYDYPKQYKEDKAFAMEALKYNGCLYRSLGDKLKADKEVILYAFDSTVNRKFYEHIPDIIPERVWYVNGLKDNGYDYTFIKTLIDKCPKMHFDRAPFLLEDHDIAKYITENAEWIYSVASSLPVKFASTIEFQDILRKRCSTFESLENIKSKLSVRGIKFLSSSLEEKIAEAKDKQGKQISDISLPEKEREP